MLSEELLFLFCELSSSPAGGWLAVVVVVGGGEVLEVEVEEEEEVEASGALFLFGRGSVDVEVEVEVDDGDEVDGHDDIDDIDIDVDVSLMPMLSTPMLVPAMANVMGRAVLASTLESVKVTRYAKERKQFPVVLSFA
ncbi:hypothetical protein A7C99_4658 [Trichophyton rubrum]|uniref:Uncharacterized protein n=1 Tax=Trichophyton rubrum TaxID=5551 RepID=A0A178EW96_TRIRU|nr:hypothetical protein A7C99_4658 [Trichophyton rubrum]